MLKVLFQALQILNSREKRWICTILVSSAVAAIIQTLSILSLMPFIVLLTNPDILESNRVLMRVYDFLGVETYHEFLVAFGAFGFVSLTVGNLFVAFEEWLSHRFFCLLEYKIQKRTLNSIMALPYETVTSVHSASLSDVVLRQVEHVVEGVIGASVAVFSGLALAGTLVLMLLIVDLQTTLVALLGLLVAYVAVFLVLRRRIESQGQDLTRLSAAMFAAVKETLDGIKEIKTRRAEAFFSRRFENSSLRVTKLAVRYAVMSFLPHYFLETVVFAGLVGVALYFLSTTADPGMSLSFVALYGMAVYRLIPALKQVFEGASEIHHNAGAVEAVLQYIPDDSAQAAARNLPKPKEALRLEHVSYRYPGATQEQLAGIEFAIPAGSSVCLFGASGSGKTTILNLLTGLIHPKAGRILCDGLVIGPETIDSWREMIGYSPQRIYLYADTLGSNIAFGVSGDAIDHERIVEVSRIANLHESVAVKLPQGYQTVLGEDGETLSGGQRQRVGIARALYHDPDVLLFDESFAGLDAENRAAILDKLLRLEGKTLIFASHEADIASRCDKVLVVEQGKLIAEGNYRELLGTSPRFVELLSRLDRE